MTIDSTTGEVTRTDDYYALAHASRFVRRGAWRVASSEALAGVANVAFVNAMAHVIVTDGLHDEAFLRELDDKVTRLRDLYSTAEAA